MIDELSAKNDEKSAVYLCRGGTDQLCRFVHRPVVSRCSEGSGDTSQAITVDGQLPNWLVEDLIRLGPSVLKTDERNYTNYLDGFGRVTKWSLDGSKNRCKFQSNMIRSLLYNDSSEAAVIPKHILLSNIPSLPSSLGYFQLKKWIILTCFCIHLRMTQRLLSV